MSIRHDIDRYELLKKARPKLRAYVLEGSHYRAVSTGNSVIYCPICKAPMVDSERGRRNHFKISPRCQEHEKTRQDAP